jgi:hypothetical protein
MRNYKNVIILVNTDNIIDILFAKFGNQNKIVITSYDLKHDYHEISLAKMEVYVPQVENKWIGFEVKKWIWYQDITTG